MESLESLGDTAMGQLRTILSRTGTTRSDEEIDHLEADRVLCDLLQVLGYEHVVQLYRRIPKSY